MKIDIQENSYANITFNNLIKVAIRGEHSYTVKYYCNDEFAGEMNLGGGNWGGYEMVVGDWRIEFWQDDNLIKIHHHKLADKNILIITSFGLTNKGKIPNFTSINEWSNEIENKYKCKIYIYFPGSETFDLPFATSKMNDNLNFDMIFEKQF